MVEQRAISYESARTAFANIWDFDAGKVMRLFELMITQSLAGLIAYDNSLLFIVPLYSNNATCLTCAERY